jgi:hypothetical protein
MRHQRSLKACAQTMLMHSVRSGTGSSRKECPMSQNVMRDDEQLVVHHDVSSIWNIWNGSVVVVVVITYHAIVTGNHTSRSLGDF